MVSHLMLAAALAATEPPAGGAATYEPPAWLGAPTLEQMEDAYPPKAWASGLEGRVDLFCKAAATGQLADCVVEREAPLDKAFGAAALQLTPLFRVSPAKWNGAPVDGAPVRFRVVFKLPYGALPNLEGTVRCYGVLETFSRLDRKDRRVARAVSAARDRALTLATASGAADDIEARLAAAVEATPPPPSLMTKSDPCFRLFVP
ncbi:TonB family protein [Caulobacter mirabilis]|uniref:TonB C-terminal domain-containing protein n=1 Tax=Caulobacter mirabilis TaxID=69666 RepID=A0A2D2AVS1_9CAUL|nr:TonB family protein [Caulobacter mirabilis]ATQ42104.1 hypothetical protein CSW64_06580 [Caulobacter mirabilis]